MIQEVVTLPLNVAIPLCLLIIKVYIYQSTQQFIANCAYYSDMF